MRLAFVTSLLPTGAADTGFEIANQAVLSAFREAGAELTLFGLLRPGERADPAHDCVVLGEAVIENAQASLGRRLGWLAASAARGLPVISAKLAPFAGRLQDAMTKAGHFDAVIVNSAPVAAAYRALLGRWPCILVAHNVEHATARENARLSGGVAGRLYAREARLLEREERKAIDGSRFVLTFAEEDRAAFGPNIAEKSSVFPLLVPQPATVPAGEVERDIGLIGTWTWQPNLVGLRWFLDEIAPRLPQDFAIGVAGRLPVGLAAPAANLQLLGRVPDAQAFVAASRVMALTSKAGTGIQLKTIETFQMGRPAVATPSSVRGLASLPTNCLVADDAASFTAALIKLVNDVRAERTMPADGGAFVSRQRDGMRAAVKAALAALAR
ncbi:MAG: glycosyltransferase [Beijerinckiaceae bacterium]